MSANKWMKQLRQAEGAVDPQYDALAPENVIKSPSPSLNWICGKTGGIPKGFSSVFYGPAKSGKSLASYLFAGQLHSVDPEAIVIRFDTEMRSTAQMKGNWGIDYDRFMAIDTNKPSQIFDYITKEINDMCEQGAPIRMIIIDSLTAIQGLREQNADSIENVQMADRAAMITKGLKQILPVIRKHKIALICTSHMRANLDAGLYGPKEKAALTFAEKHFFEMFVKVTRDNAKEGKSDLLGNALVDETVKDFKDNKEITGHKIYVKMEENSLGVAGRTGEFTISYEEGLINTHEEVFLLGINTGVVERPNNRTYVFDGKNYSSKADFANAIKNDKSLYDAILEKVRERDL